jgi:hypothetical protein
MEGFTIITETSIITIETNMRQIDGRVTYHGSNRRLTSTRKGFNNKQQVGVA